MKFIYVLPFIILSVMGLNCAPANGPLPTQSVIMPLAVGNEWIGKVIQYDVHGNPDSTWLDTLRVLNSQVVNGETWYYLNGYPPYIQWSRTPNSPYEKDTSGCVFVMRPDGIYRIQDWNFDSSQRFLSYPVRAHDYVYRVGTGRPDSTGHYLSYSYKGVDTIGLTVHVPAGSFSTIVYSIGSYSQSSDVISEGIGPGEYYAPGIGLVQYGCFEEDGRTLAPQLPQAVWQLIRAELH
ncbi:MAG: hypothetical protein ACHQNE_04570 [Candidatus Kapaibacterium sp.]